MHLAHSHAVTPRPYARAQGVGRSTSSLSATVPTSQARANDHQPSETERFITVPPARARPHRLGHSREHRHRPGENVHRHRDDTKGTGLCRLANDTGHRSGACTKRLAHMCPDIALPTRSTGAPVKGFDVSPDAEAFQAGPAQSRPRGRQLENKHAKRDASRTQTPKETGPDSARKAPTTSPVSHFRRRTTRKGGDGRCATSCGQSDVSVAKAPHNVRCRAQSWTHCGSVRSRSNRFRQACAKTPLDRRPTHCRTHGGSGEGAAFAHDRSGADRGCGAIRAERSRGRQCPQSSSTETPSWGALRSGSMRDTAIE